MILEEKIRDGKETLVYSIARPEDVDEVAVMAMESFANSTPTKEIEAIDDPSSGPERHDWYRARAEKAFAQPTSIIVREKSTNKLVGFVAMIIEERGVNPVTYSIKSNEDRSSGWLIRALLTELNRGVDLYERYGTDRILNVWFGAVIKNYRGLKIFQRKAYDSLERKIIEENDPGAMKAQPFSHFAATGKNWEIIKTIDYDTFEMPDGTRPLAGVDLGVHRSVRLVAARLQPTNPNKGQLKDLKSSL